MVLNDQGLKDREQRDSRKELKTGKGKKRGGDYFTISSFLNGTILYHPVPKQIGLGSQEAGTLKTEENERSPGLLQGGSESSSLCALLLEKTAITYTVTERIFFGAFCGKMALVQ